MIKLLLKQSNTVKNLSKKKKKKNRVVVQICHLKCGQPDCFEHVETEGDPQGVL